MRFKLAAIALGIVVVASAFGASAFTTATVQRDANINVASDSGGLIGLTAGDSELVSSPTDGQLSIDVAQGDASGVNPNSSLTIGNESSPAFNITNNFPSAHTFNVSYEMGTDPDTTTKNVKFKLFNSTDHVDTVNEDEAYKGELSTGDKLRVVVEVDSSGATKSDDLSGNLNITA
ncbi:hypothetical protein MBEHAL_1865 [Halarchaeum acidiphilum MH1-52-1]|uniref:Uncharacterized protein n=1 Tax=Halarchaeum acidiphilum MH1-52-1 TaxID=1261545 RepID=U2YVP6_9EURY|nr:hypothetical protein [Halarchaeum acidiphilum]GAD53105.1 hypothetical protein MBEHAL_1865 [Halarchaeum acidiphilum MH1-52-1]